MSEFFDTKAFLFSLQAGMAAWELEADHAVETTADYVVARAKALAPVDTGELRDSIGKLDSGHDVTGFYVDVGSADPVATYQEFGTVNDSPQPFLRPAFAEAPDRWGVNG